MEKVILSCQANLLRPQKKQTRPPPRRLRCPTSHRRSIQMYRSPHESDAEHEQYNVLMLASRRATLKREVKQGAQDPDAGRRGRGVSNDATGRRFTLSNSMAAQPIATVRLAFSSHRHRPARVLLPVHCRANLPAGHPARDQQHWRDGWWRGRKGGRRGGGAARRGTRARATRCPSEVRHGEGCLRAFIHARLGAAAGRVSTLQRVSALNRRDMGDRVIEFYLCTSYPTVLKGPPDG